MKTVDQNGNEVKPEIMVFDDEGNEIHEGTIVGPGWYCADAEDDSIHAELYVASPQTITAVINNSLEKKRK